MEEVAYLGTWLEDRGHHNGDKSMKQLSPLCPQSASREDEFLVFSLFIPEPHGIMLPTFSVVVPPQLTQSSGLFPKKF